MPSNSIFSDPIIDILIYPIQIGDPMAMHGSKFLTITPEIKQIGKIKMQCFRSFTELILVMVRIFHWHSNHLIFNKDKNTPIENEITVLVTGSD